MSRARFPGMSALVGVAATFLVIIIPGELVLPFVQSQLRLQTAAPLQFLTTRL